MHSVITIMKDYVSHACRLIVDSHDTNYGEIHLAVQSIPSHVDKLPLYYCSIHRQTTRCNKKNVTRDTLTQICKCALAITAVYIK